MLGDGKGRSRRVVMMCWSERNDFSGIEAVYRIQKLVTRHLDRTLAFEKGTCIYARQDTLDCTVNLLYTCLCQIMLYSIYVASRRTF